MKAINHPISYQTEKSRLSLLAYTSFAGYLFFTFFGTSAPFPDPGALPDTGSGNIANQLLSLFFVISMISLWGKQDEVLAFVRKEKFLTLLMLWAFCSVFWSIDPFISMKRWVALFGEFIICLAALLHYRWSEEALRPMRIILMIYLPVTILSILLVHGAIQWEFPAWRGLEDTKNNLGQISILNTILMLAIISFHKKLPVNILHYILLAFSLACLLGSRSTTSMMVCLFLLSISGMMYAGTLFKKGRVAVFYACVLLFGTGAIVAIVSFFAPEILASFFGFFGKDLTFTGRVDLWHTVISMTESKAIKGWGLGGFWIMDSSHLIPLFQEFVWIPNQSHQGYIDTYNQLGFVGLTCLILLILSYFRGLSQLKKGQVWKWIFMGLLVLNFQESVFFRPRNIGNLLFVFSYVALFTDLIKEKRRL